MTKAAMRQMCGALLLGEFLYNCCRKGVSTFGPVLIHTLGLSKSDIGMIVSSMSLCYTLSKPLFGYLTDSISNRKLFTAV
jgi:sugar phosphate permease